MKNGLYKVHFKTPIGEGAGVVRLIDGSISGGDSTTYYTGTYSVEGTTIAAEIETKRHTALPGSTSVFGIDNLNITLRGNATETSASATGTAKQAPQIHFQAALSRLAD